ncbi:hypothetical protein [Thermomonospora amylolytica]|uniref:hypothetical protein n=1 Tax=Thermomonospora amylolytica TaxID=1411117 RepID=UPI00130041F1|nr:hypothetical protein [Thermomonospora amylolytica]
MPLQITNNSNGPVLIRLRSGGTLHLSSGERSPEIQEFEVNDNPRIQSLLERDLIEVREATSKPRRNNDRRNNDHGGAGAARRRRKGTRT